MIRRRTCLAVFLSLLTLIIWWKHNGRESATERWDFQCFYISAQMVAHGQRAQLYDLKAQAEAQKRYFDPTRKVNGSDFPFVYPAAVTLVFLPLTLLPPGPAYAVWTLLSLLMLLSSLRVLQKVLPLPQGNYPLLAAVLFAPTYIVLLNGQVSMLILFLFSLGFYFFMRQQPVMAGLLLGLALVKFQVVVGLLAVLALRRMWRALAGAAVGGALVVGASVLITGWHAAIHYPAYLRQVTYCATCQKTSIAVTIPGFLWLASHHEPRIWIVVLISVVLLVVAAVAWRGFQTGFSLAITVSLMTAFHGHIPELTLLLVPFAVAYCRVSPHVRNWAVLAIIIAGYLSLLGPYDTLFALFCDGLVVAGIAFHPTAQDGVGSFSPVRHPSIIGAPGGRSS